MASQALLSPSYLTSLTGCCYCAARRYSPYHHPQIADASQAEGAAEEDSARLQSIVAELRTELAAEKVLIVVAACAFSGDRALQDDTVSGCWIMHSPRLSLRAGLALVCSWLFG